MSAFLLAAALVFLFTCSGFAVSGRPSRTSSRYAYEIDQYNVSIQVGEDNVYHVTEELNVHYNQSRRGILRYITYRGAIGREIEGKLLQHSYRAKITDVNVEGAPFTTYKEDGNFVIQIGDPNRYVTGDQSYRISYSYDPGEDGTSVLDEVYYNLIPDDWDAPIAAGAFTVTLPKSFDTQKVEFTGGRYGGVDTGLVDWSVSGNTISGQLTRSLSPGEGITLRVNLPDGYFVGVRTDLGLVVLLYAITLAAGAAGIFLWFKLGRDEKLVPTVEFYPPEGLTSADVGYIIDGYSDNEDLISLIIYWASKGYLKIEETDPGFVLYKLQELPMDAKSYENILFQGLFHSRDSVSDKELEEKFHSTLESAKTQLKDYFQSSKSRRIFTGSSLVARVLASLIAIVPIAALALLGSYIKVVSELWFVPVALFAVLFLISLILMMVTYDRWNSQSSGKRLGLFGGSCVLCGVSLLFLMCYGVYIVSMPAATLLCIGASVLLALLAVVMKKHTPQGQAWTEKILGLREFIETAELDRINTLVEENPEYFYSVLPFAYVLGLTDKWAKQFESIAVPPPTWYVSSDPHSVYTTMWMVRRLNRCTRSMAHAMTSVPPPPPSARSSNRGSGRSGRSGGFSGGGHGGGGGRSW
ncbi:DUF2207 domain-containing protein [Phocea massiliensis]|uniref:DUF2207 domain-containing protein n=1 Tax=Merdimmobilis hominis TaxID=2897707 RepID=UPI001E63778A|nr:DUF2207 domain-containing protein [Merdimmobilis hominis]MCD4835815.1 DUF2207 domain-containing protein [Merdimmobilis hominis]